MSGYYCTIDSDHVIIQSKLKFLIGAKDLGLQKLGFEVETGPNATVLVYHVVKPLQPFGSDFNAHQELF